jgi:acetyl esterase/lipase
VRAWDNAVPAEISPPLRGTLAGLPPAVVVTAEFDPLRDEGEAYAEALAAADVPVRHIRARGQIHTSLTHGRRSDIRGTGPGRDG